MVWNQQIANLDTFYKGTILKSSHLTVSIHGKILKGDWTLKASIATVYYPARATKWVFTVMCVNIDIAMRIYLYARSTTSIGRSV